MMKRIRITVLFFLAACGFCGCVFAEQKKSAVAPEHHADNGYVNPHVESYNRGIFRYLRMRWFGDEEFADYQATAHRVAAVKPDLQQISQPGEGPQVTWIGHATVLVQYRGIAVLTDPVFSDRASPLPFMGPRRAQPPALTMAELPPIDYVVVSHNHYDHLDIPSVRRIGSAACWLVPLGLKEKLLDAGIAGSRVRELDWWEQASLPGVTVTATPAQHWSSRTLWDRNESLWASWLVQIDDFTFWYSGDTGYNAYQFKEIGRRFPFIDLGLISIGAYAPRWFMKDVHVNPAEAVRIHLDTGARRSLAIQWGTFPLTSEPIDEPPARLRRALEDEGLPPENFVAPAIGETWKKDQPNE